MVYRAVEQIGSRAKQNEKSDKKILERILSEASVRTDTDSLIHNLLNACDITLNFHPDRL